MVVTVSISVAMIVMVMVLYLQKMKEGAKGWLKELLLTRKAEAQMHYVLYGWLPIRMNDCGLYETDRTVNEFWQYIRQGNYPMWYYRFFLMWKFMWFRTIALCTLFIVAPIFPSATDFAPLLRVIGSLGASLQELARNLLEVLIASQQVAEVAELLNLQSSENVLAQSGRTGGGGHDKAQKQLKEFEDYSKTLDREVQEWSVNAEDAKSTSKLIAKAVAVGKTCRLSPSVIHEMVDLVGAWATLLDPKAGDDGGKAGDHGAFLIHNVTHVLRSPIGEVFSGLCVRDARLMGKLSSSMATLGGSLWMEF